MSNPYGCQDAKEKANVESFGPKQMKLWHENDLGVRGCRWYRWNRELGTWF